jgi:hypothetical protein
LGEGSFVNTFHFSSAGSAEPTVAEMDVLLGLVADFYNLAVSSPVARSVSSYFSPMVDESGALLLKGYWKDGQEPAPFGSPVSSIVAGLTAQTSTFAFPSHTAAVLTLEGEDYNDVPVELPGPPVTRPMKRRRGRLYLGPLGIDAGTTAAQSDCKVDPNFIGVCAAAANRLNDAVIALPDPIGWWGVWSQADEVIYHLEAVSMDDRFDVVGSRKRLASTRTTTVV